jgi:hypothetical protein
MLCQLCSFEYSFQNFKARIVADGMVNAIELDLENLVQYIDEIYLIETSTLHLARLNGQNISESCAHVKFEISL